ncbi:serine/threonine-protein kinase [Streptosporangium sp. KLBMP 9127]|nr:protein kinase [Streptosporangium sp. KLBMP 9127]
MLTRRYRLLERIASGGMSAIWRAFDQSLHRMVAVKVLDGPLGADHGERDLIRREARATARLIHPDAIEVYDYGETITSGGRMAAYVVMRLLDGRPLSERITEGPLPWREAVPIAVRMATVLAAAHERGIVHRDVTAENVLLTCDGAKLLDFGIAAFVGEQIDESLAEYGTPPYVAPERLEGAAIDPAVDVYSLGVLLFEMLTGRTPYPETTWEEIELARRDRRPPVPEVPGLPNEVAALCQWCLDPDPELRPQAQHVAERLGRVLVSPAPVRSRGLVAAVSVAVTLAASLGVAAWTEGTGAPESFAAPATSTRPPTTPSITKPPTDPSTRLSDTGPSQNGSSQNGSAELEPSGIGPSGVSVVGPSAAASPDMTAKPYRSNKPGVRTTPAPDRTKTLDVSRRPAPSLPDAVEAFTMTVSLAEEDELIVQHVALDLNQVARNLLNDADPGRALAGLRTKVLDRYREGLLPQPLLQSLDVRLSGIDSALIRPTGQA